MNCPDGAESHALTAFRATGLVHYGRRFRQLWVFLVRRIPRHRDVCELHARRQRGCFFAHRHPKRPRFGQIHGIRSPYGNGRSDRGIGMFTDKRARGKGLKPHLDGKLP